VSQRTHTYEVAFEKVRVVVEGPINDEAFRVAAREALRSQNGGVQAFVTADNNRVQWVHISSSDVETRTTSPAKPDNARGFDL
jgi:hypothetical protein